MASRYSKESVVLDKDYYGGVSDQCMSCICCDVCIKSGLVYRYHKPTLELARKRSWYDLAKYIRNTSRNYLKKVNVKKYVYEKFNYKCAACGETENLHIDHILPKSAIEEKANCILNLQLLCKRCNSKKGTKMPEGYHYGS